MGGTLAQDTGVSSVEEPPVEEPPLSIVVGFEHAPEFRRLVIVIPLFQHKRLFLAWQITNAKVLKHSFCFLQVYLIRMIDVLVERNRLLDVSRQSW